MLSDAGSLGDSQSVVPLSDIDQCLLIYPGLDQSQQAAAMLGYPLYIAGLAHDDAIAQSPSPTQAPIKSSERVLQDFKILSLQRVDVNYGGGLHIVGFSPSTRLPRSGGSWTINV
ncbi:hypothetical protein AGABI1DRAFT_130022 [Agaricus bisporus var. burnettii JB137-S8]|uniref:Uncharacterized protein n=1 Tax=Agaricus bisporus var. burnettii (strain JB137-S8 / ATCC MYA-4627 / FGSC 10392) TaxID=597362 RepID=K5XH31_AGABU|nr:uncharacterized protein AGABI1DRAFT_130022 [Agaricus bisporus var. burnettii JB137-S8]XP_007335651.1 uncharacterized protein AGABI1DRAFT_134215 [Agaricus bisporus var. burnettii JB137-S8]EKM73710.1 hypothetical protein AGABI1DRAFT_134215 [Agaricus bisporus var. burnettii JB137-S8]EKM77741.1 hypothetical protein AGABI1DRAFT_130022 [Agaricus bisporus var. burnettii JB137-S8]